MRLEEDLAEAARDEMERATTLGWGELAKHAPWGDVYEGFSPEGREVCFERNYLWEAGPGGDIRVEVNVFEPEEYERGVHLVQRIPRRG